VIRAILFDLDGTLLDIDIDAFLRGYFSALGPVVATLGTSADPHSALKAVLASTDTMCRPHPGRTNREVFHERFLELTGVDLDEPVAAAAIARFYSESFPPLGEGHGPRPGGIDAVHAARHSGRRVALATNPIFPRAAVDERMRWAGLAQEWFDVVTSYENMRACKPQIEYFEQTELAQISFSLVKLQ
jgi:FMN phosphatase YigB (HAD superfamily)